MKKLIFLSFIVTLVFGGMPVLAGEVTKSYGDRTLNNWENGSLDDIWDLTQCDLTLTYTIDMSKITNAGWAVTEVGLRSMGAPNIDPNLQGGWMQSNYIFGGSNPDSRNNNDMHLLSKHGWLYQTYDATDANTLVTPYWSNDNHGFWFDRDGVDVWQAALWGAAGTYNTGGVYDIVIAYRAINGTTGTMFATINGVMQGLYIGGWKDAQPEFYPAGKSFATSDMSQMLVFYGRGEGDGTVTLSDITVTGCLYWTEVEIDIKPGSDPNSINLGSKGVVPVAVLTTPDFDASTVAGSTVLFAGASPVRWTLEDVDGDGDIDILFHFNTQDLSLTGTSTTATLTGDSTDGKHIRGTDTVNIVPKGK